MNNEPHCQYEGCNCTKTNNGLWGLSFSSEFDFDDDCAKYKPCYIARPGHEAIETEVVNSNQSSNCFLIGLGIRQETAIGQIE